MYHFFAYMSRMKYIHRWGLMRNTIPENDMEHALQTAMIAHAMAVIGITRYQRTYDPGQVMSIALYHDACEVITGDLPTPVKHNNPVIRAEYQKLELVAASRLLTMLPDDLRTAFTPLINHDENTLVWRIVKAADRICAFIKCLEEKKAGNSEFLSAEITIKATIDAIDLPEVEDFLQDFLPGFALSLDEIS